jgi:hypothetical protein
VPRPVFDRLKPSTSKWYSDPLAQSAAPAYVEEKEDYRMRRVANAYAHKYDLDGSEIAGEN